MCLQHRPSKYESFREGLYENCQLYYPKQTATTTTTTQKYPPILFGRERERPLTFLMFRNLNELADDLTDSARLMSCSLRWFFHFVFLFNKTSCRQSLVSQLLKLQFQHPLQSYSTNWVKLDSKEPAHLLQPPMIASAWKPTCNQLEIPFAH